MIKTIVTALFLVVAVAAVGNAQPYLLYINEFMADNDSAIVDPGGDYDDWLEIYNGGSQALNLEGMYLTDDFGEPTQWEFPDVTIEPGGFLLVWCDEDEGDPGIHTNFKLSRSGEEIGFYDTDGSTIIDTITFGSQQTDISYGRETDGSPTWIFFSESTPGYSNGQQTDPPPLYLNEFMASNESIIADPQGEYEDWIEIYNSADSAINLAGMHLTDDFGEPLQWTFPDVTIDSHGYLMVWCDNDEGDEGIHTNFKLSDDGEEIGFYGTAGGIVDTITFGTQGTDVSYGREHDGQFPWIFFEDPTPGGPNSPTGVDENADGLPSEFWLGNNYPNPFNSATTISFDLPYECYVNLTVFNILGQEIAVLEDGNHDAGSFKTTWNADDSPSGVYFYRLKTDGFDDIRKMILLK